MALLGNIALLLVGFVLLIKGADFFVDGSAALARRFRVPGVIIGLTIVAMGTSAPELAVSTSAAINGSNEIALSNVIGSNMFNLLMVLGICAMICPLPIDKVIMKRDFPLSIGITLLVLVWIGIPVLSSGVLGKAVMADNVTEVSRILGLLLLLLFILYIWWLIRDARKNPMKEDDTPPMPLWKCALLILGGVAGIVAGGQFVVNSAKEIARTFGMSETLIGLTIVAVGTSLPELVTSIVASRKGENGLAVGNVVGSNIFNLLLILGVSSSIHPIAVNLASVIDLIILLGVSCLAFLFARKNKIGRAEGAVMVALYAADVVFAILR